LCSIAHRRAVRFELIFADHPAASRPDSAPLAKGPVNEAGGQLQAFDIGSLPFQSPCAVCPVFRQRTPGAPNERAATHESCKPKNSQQPACCTVGQELSEP